MFIAFVAAVAVFFVQRNIKFLGVDDRLDVFSFHGVAGMIGTAMTGLFATKSADSPADGAFYGSRGKQFAVQLAGVATTILLCSVGTTVIFHALDQLSRALGQDMRIAHSVEDIDASQHGESAYYYEGSVRGGGGGGDGSVHGGSASSNATALLAAAAPEASARPAKHVTIQQN
jgi:Amt family ammonium transporter